MIAGLAKAINQFLAPLLMFTSLLLIIFAYLAPTVMLTGQVALLTVTPSVSLTQPTNSAQIDGPSVYLGALGSCQRSNSDAAITCTLATVSPQYNLSDLPGNAPDLLSAPTATTPVFIAVALAFTLIFFILFTMAALKTKLGKFANWTENPTMQRTTAWIGLFGFMIGLTSFLIIRMWFGKAVEDFNKAIVKGGDGAPHLVAATSNGFIMIYVAYAFYAIPLVCSLAKFHVTPAEKA